MKHAEKSKKGDQSSVGSAKSKSQHPVFQFIDDRSIAKGHQAKKELADGSQQVQSLKAIQQMADASATGAVVQAKLKDPFSKSHDHELQTISTAITNYNKIGGFRFSFPIDERKQALNQLSVIEHLIYSWFGNHQKQGSPEDEQMRYLMNWVLHERQDLVALSLKNNDKEPPVANFDELPIELRNRIILLWQELLKNDSIRIEGNHQFKVKIMTDFSRLLETKMGRTLIGGIIETAKGLVISPTSLAHGKFVARPVEPDKEKLENSDSGAGFVQISVSGTHERNRQKMLQHVKTFNPQSKGVTVMSEKGTKHYKFGEGSGSTLPVPVDSQDSIPHPSSRMADEVGNEVIAPTFINLGHELGHVLRSAQGISASGGAGMDLVKHGFNKPEVSRPEEFFNIGAVENSLRRQSGIKERHGHGNYYTFWANEGMRSVFRMKEEIGVIKTNIDPQSVEYGQLEMVDHELDALFEPFQHLMNGKGNALELMEFVEKHASSLKHIVSSLAAQDRARRTHEVIHQHGGVVNVGSEGNRAIGNFDL
ncbi:MAG: hypothetical protein AAFQ94_10760 [Bacteroidota bacterium]